MRQQLPESIKSVWRLQASLNLLIEIIVIVGMVCGFYFLKWPMWIVAIIAMIGIIFSVGEFILIPYRYQFWRYQISDHDVEMTTGFFIKKTTAVPILRIQDVTLSAGPLLQFKKLQSVKIHTAAAVHEIGGVDRQTATKLKTKIMDLAKEEDVYES
ncbi:PH domain-containing protein [Weissella sagaensis]|uniref:PH domain-containing protein n=1 Tax=Weissella sagaensis TaxID=2559928 RepID=UPI0013ED82DD|nr:PH domain-containing protein [Weissella sagaensis]